MAHSNRDVENFLNIYDLFRKYIEHEDQLINNRLSWMLTIHGFLYATYGITALKLLEINQKISESGVACYPMNSLFWFSLAQVFGFLICICLVGLTISFSASKSIKAAFYAASSVKDLFENYAKSNSYIVNSGGKSETLSVYPQKDESIELRFPLLTGGGCSKGEIKGFTAARFIPLALIISWFMSGGLVGLEFISGFNLFSRDDKCHHQTNPSPSEDGQQSPKTSASPQK